MEPVNTQTDKKINSEYNIALKCIVFTYRKVHEIKIDWKK